jgi:hypothetical protein
MSGSVKELSVEIIARDEAEADLKRIDTGRSPGVSTKQK